ncbi:MAG TPA: NADP-dependent malic enzyme [Nitrososphaerales archaeon]|nr:NADP-dependent malic enzyme [Nitrososphaerales archaeon]
MRTTSRKRTAQRKGTKIADPSQLALTYSKYYEGKVQIIPKVPVTSLNDFSIWYTPGVAAVSLEVAKNPDLSFEYTNRWNMLCILTDGSRVLGLGDIGPEASLPVMEGKALIYKYLGGVDAVPVPVSAHGPEEMIRFATQIEPAFGAIHLEDIASPKCFQILDSLREKLTIPVWHDDQQGTAGVILAGLLNSLYLTERKLKDSRIVLLGAGAANIAAARLVISAGLPAGQLVLVDSKGILNPERQDMDQLMLQNKWKYELALKTNDEKLAGDLDVAVKGADALIAASKPGPDVIAPSTLKKMNKDSILFALSNPVPEIWPKDAREAGVRIVATGRSDFPNQVNNSLIFPSVIRGVLDVRSKAIPDEAIISAAQELADFSKRGHTLDDEHILPTMMDREIYPLVASAVGEKCIQLGIARKSMTQRQLRERARVVIEQSQKTIAKLQASKLIAPMSGVRLDAK